MKTVLRMAIKKLAPAVFAVILVACTPAGRPEGDISNDRKPRDIPRFVAHDFTQLEKIASVSRFRSAAGHDYSDANESCRSMKHYFAPVPAYRKNGEIEIYAPVDGVIRSILDERHGASEGLANKQVRIRCTARPAFTFVLFHVDLISPEITVGKRVRAGQRIGHARLYYPDLGEVAHDFDIAVWHRTPSGTRYISYFETMTDGLFQRYVARGARSRKDFVISREERDGDPLPCRNGRFLRRGSLKNWVNLKQENRAEGEAKKGKGKLTH